MSNDSVFGYILGGLFLVAIMFLVVRAIWYFFSGIREGFERPHAAKKREPDSQCAPQRQPRPDPQHSSDRHEKKSSEKLPRIMFISYRREDSSDVTGRIYDRLVAKFGEASVSIDVHTIDIGDDFRRNIEDAVAKSTVVLAVIGPRWLGNDPATGTRRLSQARDFVRIELAAALERGVSIVPVLVSGASMPDESELPEKLSELVYRNAIPVRPDPDFHNDVDRLVRGIEKIFDRHST